MVLAFSIVLHKYNATFTEPTDREPIEEPVQEQTRTTQNRDRSATTRPRLSADALTLNEQPDRDHLFATWEEENADEWNELDDELQMCTYTYFILELSSSPEAAISGCLSEFELLDEVE